MGPYGFGKFLHPPHPLQFSHKDKGDFQDFEEKMENYEAKWKNSTFHSHPIKSLLPTHPVGIGTLARPSQMSFPPLRIFATESSPRRSRSNRRRRRTSHWSTRIGRSMGPPYC